MPCGTWLRLATLMSVAPKWLRCCTKCLATLVTAATLRSPKKCCVVCTWPAWLVVPAAAASCWSLVRRRHLLHALSSKRAQDICHDTSLKFFVGQRVLVIKEKGGQFAGVPVTKWHEPTHCPYRVVETLPNDNYKLSDLPSRRFHDTFHVSRLVPYPLVTSEGDGPLPDGEYIVDRIADRRLIPGLPPDELGSYEYLVHWLGYAPTDDTWESVRVLAECHGRHKRLQPPPSRPSDRATS